MKDKFGLILIMLILTMPSFRAVEVSNVETLVNFKDSNLEQCVKSELNINSGFIYTNDLESLTSLSCTNQNISNLSGIENATNLVTLNLSNNQISDISSLSNLIKLRNLDISSNNIESINSLKNLTDLNTLKISDNQIQDITTIENIVGLERFEANSNKITDISSLSLLDNIRYVQMNHNEITDISSISNLTNLSQLLLDDNNITFIPNLSVLENLKQLSLRANQISELTDISGTSLVSLDVSNNNLTSLDHLGHSKTLKDLDLSNNNIAEVDGLEQLQVLEDVNLSYNAIDNISKIDTNQELVKINLRNNNIEDISPLNNLVNLEEVNLSQNQITQASDFSNLNNLKSINLSENGITDLSNLSNFEHVNINAENQVINLNPKVVYTNNSVSYTIKGLNAELYTIDFNIDKTGTETYSKSWHSSNQKNYIYSGTISQDITYLPNGPIVADSEKTIDEEKPYSDQQLIDLFNVESEINQKISVDQSKVNYSKPGKYKIIFKDEVSNQVVVNLTIKDIKPKITTKEKSAVIDGSNSVIDYLTLYSPTASELTSGDLDSKIVIDDTAVDFENPGTYEVIFKVQDEEGNVASKVVSLTNTIADNQVVISTVDPAVSINGNKIQINKFSATGESLAGIEYTIYDEAGNIIEVITTDENGFAESSNLVSGHYYVEQTGVLDNVGKDSNESPEDSCTDSSPQAKDKCSTQSLTDSDEDLNNPSKDSIVDSGSDGLSQVENADSNSSEISELVSENVDLETSEINGENINNVFEKKDNNKKISMLLLFILLVAGIIFIFIVKVKKDE